MHIFGFGSDIERTDLLYTSVLIQMAHGLVGARVPDWSSSPRAWRRSWLLGFATAVIDGTDHSQLSRAKLLGAAAALSRYLRKEFSDERIAIVLPASKASMLANLAVTLADKVPVDLNFTVGRAANESC